jgi:hypothetical protein
VTLSIMIFHKVRAKNIITNSTLKWSIRARLVFDVLAAHAKLKYDVQPVSTGP